MGEGWSERGKYFSLHSSWGGLLGARSKNQLDFGARLAAERSWSDAGNTLCAGDELAVLAQERFSGDVEREQAVERRNVNRPIGRQHTLGCSDLELGHFNGATVAVDCDGCPTDAVTLFEAVRRAVRCQELDRKARLARAAHREGVAGCCFGGCGEATPANEETDQSGRNTNCSRHGALLRELL